MENQFKILNGIALALALFVILLFVDLLWTKKEVRSGIIIDKQYEAEFSSTGIGTGVNSNGGVTTVVTTSNEPEKWLLILKDDSEVFSIKVDPEDYYKSNVGETHDYTFVKGKILGIEDRI